MTTTILTSGQTYKCDHLGQQWLTGLLARLPNASCFNFFCTCTTKYFEILWQPTNGTFAFAPTAQINPLAKAKEPFFSQCFIKKHILETQNCSRLNR